MRIAVITDDMLKEELMSLGASDDLSIEWLTEPKLVKGIGCYIDLLFRNEPDYTELLKNLEPATIIVNDTIGAEILPGTFIRINGWRSFLKRNILEAAGQDPAGKILTEKIFAGFNRKVEWTPDQPGFITARVISMIINEAYFALGENVSTRADIDEAMKTGTNYPYGPFEWSELIGLKNVYELLMSLSKGNARYQPAPMLIKEAFPA